MLVSDINNHNKTRYRSNQDITQILTAAKEPKGKTRLMYSSMISAAQLKEYLNEILDKNYYHLIKQLEHIKPLNKD